MLAGPLIGHICIWLLMLWMKNADLEPPAPTSHSSRSPANGPETIALRRMRPGNALSDFVKAMREEDDAPAQTSSRLTPGIPTRIHIHSPKPAIPSPLFPLSAPLTNNPLEMPRDPRIQTFSHQMNASIDMSTTKSPRPVKTACLASLLEENENNHASNRSALSPPSYSELIDEANSIPLSQSPVNQAMTHPGPGRRVCFTPHIRVASTGAQLFPTNEYNPLSPNIDLPTSPVRPAVWEEEDEVGIML